MCIFVTCNQIKFGPMKLKRIIFCLLAWLALTATAQPVQQQEQWDWYLGEVVNDTFVGRNYFEYYYTPSATDMEQQRSRGEVTYFLNSPDGLNSKKVRDMIDRLMASYDDIKAVTGWQMTSTTYWKEFRYEKNKFRFSVKRKALDDGTYYVSAIETASYYKSLGKDKKSEKAAAQQPSSIDKPSKRGNSGRRAITPQDVEAAQLDDIPAGDPADEVVTAPVITEKERRRAAREREQALKQQERLAKRRAQEQQREEAKKKKEAEKQLKAEQKKKKEEEKRLAMEEKRRQREQARIEREEANREKIAQKKQAAEHKQTASSQPVESNYHYDDVALWLSEKYDFTQVAAGENSCTMYSAAVKDNEMAKLAIKNALKGSNARMAVPWRVNGDTQAVETGYTVDDHVLVFAIGKDAEQRITLTISEVSNDQFELFKQRLNP